jgi:hypothetical protein
VRKNRKTDWIDTFVAQTFLYVVVASLDKHPYLCSSIRVAIVQDLISRICGQFFSVVHGSIGVVSAEARRKVQAVLDFLGEGAVSTMFCPALLYVMLRTPSRKEFLPTLFRLRREKAVGNFRKWCKSLEDAWRSEDIDSVYHGIEELRSVSESLSQGWVDPISGVIAYVPDVQALTIDGQRNAVSSEEHFVKSCYSPSLVFLKDVGAYLGTIAKNRAAIESVLEHKIDENDLRVLSELETKKQKLYSQGRLARRAEGLVVQRVDKLEVAMGDKFENIHGSVIATRGSIAKGVVSLQDQGRDDLARAIEELTALISGSALLDDEKKAESTALLMGITEEAVKPEPNKSIIRSLGTSLMTILTSAAPLAQAAASGLATIRTLWS